MKVLQSILQDEMINKLEMLELFNYQDIPRFLREKNTMYVAGYVARKWKYRFYKCENVAKVVKTN